MNNTPNGWGTPDDNTPWGNAQQPVQQHAQTPPQRAPQNMPQKAPAPPPAMPAPQTGSASKWLIPLICGFLGAAVAIGGFIAGSYYFSGRGRSDTAAEHSVTEQTSDADSGRHAGTDTTAAQADPLLTLDTVPNVRPSETETTSVITETTSAATSETTTETTTVTSTEAPVIQTTAALALQDVSFYQDSFLMYVWTDDGSSVNMRREPSLNGAKILLIPDGTAVTALGESNGWVFISYGGNTGFVRRDLLRYEDSGLSGGWPMFVSTSTGQSVNLRSSPSVNSKSLALVPNGAQVDCWAHENGWYSVKYNGQFGYIREDLLEGQ